MLLLVFLCSIFTVIRCNAPDTVADSTRSHTVSTRAGFDAATAPAVTSSELYQYGDQIEYTCDTGYATNPETKIADTSNSFSVTQTPTCDSDGVWSPGLLPCTSMLD